MKSADAIPRVSHRWFRARGDGVRAAADDVLREALEIAAWDATFVPAKLYRALVGRDEPRTGRGVRRRPGAERLERIGERWR